jgi:tetratricopeptide (TPR) repeat protein
MRTHCACICLLSLIGSAQAAQPPDPATPASPAQRLWQQGQDLMLDGATDKAIACYHESLKLEPNLAQNYLSLAAAFLDKGEDAKAADSLSRYLAMQPNHFVARAHYAELLLRMHKPESARTQFERFIADIQDRDDLAQQHLVHCHSRLMEIAEAEEDEYAAHLHRGIGLYCLARERAQVGDAEQGRQAESLLCKAAGELALARQCRPDEARPSWYLFEVWSRLALRQPASRSLKAAESAAAFTYLTPAEQRSLQLVWRQWQGERQHK